GPKGGPEAAPAAGTPDPVDPAPGSSGTPMSAASLGSSVGPLEVIQTSHVKEAGAPALGSGQSRPDQRPEQRVGSIRPALELRMGLGPDPERVTGQLDELHQPVIRGRSRTHQAGVLQPVPVPGVDFVAVPVAFVDQLVAVGEGDLRAVLQ